MSQQPENKNEDHNKKNHFLSACFSSWHLSSLRPSFVSIPSEEPLEETAAAGAGAAVIMDRRAVPTNSADLLLGGGDRTITDANHHHHHQQQQQQQQQHHQGVLWKRRDVFKNRWRPRWFVLQPGPGILTYYILTGDAVVPDTVVTASTTSSSNRNNNNNINNNNINSDHSAFWTNTMITNVDLLTSPAAASVPPSRNRTSSWDSRASENTVDYDVVPRGTIYLFGCTCQANSSLSRPHENLYCLTIYPPSLTETQIHLAARTAEMRDRWVEMISAVCHHTPTASSATTTAAGTATSLRTSKTKTTPITTAIPENRPIPTPPTTPSHSPPSRSSTDDPLAAAEATTAKTIQQQSSISARNHDDSESSSFGWKSLGSPSEVYDNLLTDSPLLADRIQQTLKMCLDIMDEEHERENQPDSPDNDNNNAEEEEAPARPYNDTSNNNNHNEQWKVLYRKEKAAAYRRRPTATTQNTATGAASSAAMIKIDANLNVPLLQVFELLVDSQRRADYEGDNGSSGSGNSVRESRRLQQINPHTFFDYYAYNAIWPASPREFAVVTHWQVLVRKRRRKQQNRNNQQQNEQEGVDGGNDEDKDKNNNDDSNTEKAIAILSFSCPEADEAVERTSSSMGHIRGKVHQSLILLRESNNEADNPQQSGSSCHLTKILSIDLGGGVTSHFLNVTLNQRANLPLRLNNYFRQYEPVPEPRHHHHKGSLTDENLVRQIISRLDETREASMKRRKTTLTRDNSRITLPSSSDHDYDVSEDNDDQWMMFDDEFLLPPLDQQARLLLAPLLVYQLAVLANAPSPAFWFGVSLFFAIRQLVILHIGGEEVAVKHLRHARPIQELLVGPVTCRFRVDLKGVLRFIANKKEEREELKRGTAEITVSHIVACAVASALKKEEKLYVKRVSIPYLFIDRLVCRGSEPVSVTFLSDTGDGGSQAITLQNVDTHNVQRVADDMKNAAESEDAHDGTVGMCLIVATPNYSQVEMETDVLPRHPNVSVVCTIGGVHLERNSNTRSSSTSSQIPRSRGPRPVLSLSLTVANRYPTDFIACRRFAEDVQTLLQFPEMCDD